MKKTILLTLTAVFMLTIGCFADFKFGLLEAVKDTAKQLDIAYIKKGGGIPLPPRNLSGIASSLNQINLTWTSNSTNEFGFRIQRKTNTTNYSILATVSKAITSYNDTTVNPNSDYYYKVSAYNDTGESSYSLEAHVKTGTLSVVKLATFTSGKNVYKTSVLGNYAYSLMDNSLAIINISSPTLPVSLGTITGLSNSPSDIYVQGNYAYVADGTNGLRIIDCSNKNSPSLVGTFSAYNSSTLNVTSVKVSGNNAYIGDGYNGLKVVDISIPATPSFVGSYSTGNTSSNYIYSIVLSGNYAYLACGSSGVLVVNVQTASNPYQIMQLNNYNINNNNNYNSGPTNNNSRSVAISGNYLYIADDNNGLVIFDISTVSSSSSQIKSKYSNPSSGTSIYDVQVKNNYAFLADSSAGLKVVSVSDPASPAESGSYTATSCRSVYVYNNKVYLSHGTNLDIFQTNASTTTSAVPNIPLNLTSSSTKSKITLVWQDNSDNETGFNIERKTSANGSYLNIGQVGENVTTFDDTFALTAGTSYYYRINAYNSTGTSAYSNEIGPTILSTNPLIGKFSTSGTVYDIFVSSQYAFLAAGNHGLIVLNITDPINPINSGSHNTSSILYGVCTSGNYIYTAYGYSGIEAFDITTLPTSSPMVSVGNYSSTYGTANGICVSGKYAYLSDGSASNDLCIFDISNPSSLNSSTPRTYNNVSGNAQAVAVSGNFAYLAFDSNQGFSILDVSNPSANPTLKKQTTISGTCYGICVSSNYAYVAGSFGLKIYNITNPTAPSLIKTYTTSSCGKICLYGNYVYLAEGSNGIEILDVSNPASPILLKSFKPVGGTGASVNSIFAKGLYVYCGLSGGDMDIFDFGITPPASSIIPDKPANFTVSKASNTFINLAWTDSSNNETGFKIAKSTFTQSNGVIIATLPANSTSYSDTGLIPNTSYYYTVYSYNSAGNSINPDTVLGCTRLYSVKELGIYVPTDGSLFYKVFVSSNYAYVSCQGKGLKIINISDPENPTLTANYTLKQVYSAYVANNTAYLGTTSDLTKLDLTTPSNPTLLGALSTGNYGCYSVKVVASTAAYVAASYNGLQVQNISANTPTALGYYTPSGGNYYDVDVLGNYAYIADYSSGLTILNISNPASILLVNSYSTANASAVKVSGKYAYVASGSNGLKIIDKSIPTNLSLAATFSMNVNNAYTYSVAYDVFVKGNYAYVCDSYYSILRILNISDPANPREVANFTVPTTGLSGVFVSGNYIYLACSSGLRILKATLP